MAVRVEVGGPNEVEEVWLGDDGPFEFEIPKISPIMSAMMKARKMPKDSAALEKATEKLVEMQEEWLRKGFGPDQWAHITKRLQSIDDPLDWKHIFKVFEELFGGAAGRPPTLSGDFSEGSSQSPFGDGASPAVSTRTTSIQGAPATS